MLRRRSLKTNITVTARVPRQLSWSLPEAEPVQQSKRIRLEDPQFHGGTSSRQHDSQPSLPARCCNCTSKAACKTKRCTCQKAGTFCTVDHR